MSVLDDIEYPEEQYQEFTGIVAALGPKAGAYKVQCEAEDRFPEPVAKALAKRYFIEHGDKLSKDFNDEAIVLTAKHGVEEARKIGAERLRKNRRPVDAGNVIPIDGKQRAALLAPGAAQKTAQDRQTLTTIEDFNSQFFVVRHLFGKCRIAWLEETVNHRTGAKSVTLEYKELSDFFVAYADKKDHNNKALAKEWFTDIDTRRYDKVVYKDPAFKLPNEFNLYQGFSVDPIDGDITRYIDFVTEIACQGNKELAEYWLNLAAYGVQNPFKRWDVFVICYSKEEGTGKDTFVDFYGDMFIDYFVTRKSDRVLGRFNEQIAYKSVVKLEEASIPDKDMETLRGNVTGATLDVEGKGKKGGNTENIIKFFMTTNSEACVKVSSSDRRIFLLEFFKSKVGDREYFKKLYRWYYKEGGVNKVLHYLKQRQLGQFEPYPRPITKLLRRMQDNSLPADEMALLEMLTDGFIWKRKSKDNTYLDQYRTKERHYEINTSSFREHYEKKYPGLDKLSDNKLTDKFKLLGFEQKRRADGINWILPDLSVAREKWDELKRMEREWNDTKVWWHNLNPKEVGSNSGAKVSDNDGDANDDPSSDLDEIAY